MSKTESPKTMYRAKTYAPFVDARTVVKETASTVVLTGNRKEGKFTRYQGWFDTEEEAWTWCAEYWAKQIESAQRNLKYHEQQFAEVGKACANRMASRETEAK